MEKQLEMFKKQFPYIFLFGTGKMALPLKRYLEKCGIKFQGMIVSEKNENTFDGISVYEPGEIVYDLEDCGIILALLSKSHKDVLSFLREYGFKHFLQFDDEQLRKYFWEFNTFNVEKLKKYSSYIPKKQEMPLYWGHVLVIRLDGIGDTVLMTPLLRELHRNHPESYITLLTSEASYNLFEVCPYVNEVISVNVADISRGYLEEQLIKSKKFMEKILHGRKVDVSMVPRWDADDYGASFLSFFSGAQYSVAYSESVIEHKRLRNKNYDLMFSHILDESSLLHETERSLFLLRATGCSVIDDSLELWDDDKDEIFVDQFLLETRITKNQKIIMIGLDAGLENKKWDYSRYLELISRISEEFCNLFFVLLGGAGVYKIAYQGENIVNGVGKLNLRQTFALAKRAFMYVGNDTGIMHIAAAAGNCVLEISSFPKNDNLYNNTTYRFRPWGVPYYIAQPQTGKDDCRGWCHEPYAHCINQVSVEDAFQGFKYLFNKNIR